METVKFLQSASHWKQFPVGKNPQVALAGRSNSGKSSFVNTLARRKTAKISGTPGKTCLLNIFDFKNLFWLVDMPGYGYGARSHKERESWKKMVEGYLLNSLSLKGVILLMDIRRQWSQEEIQLVDFCKAMDTEIMVVLTKADKLPRSQWKPMVPYLQKSSGLPCFAISSLKKWGTREVVDYIIKNWIYTDPV